MKILILTLYPAPYRVALYEKIAEKHNITVFFEKDNDNRNPLYCTYSDKFQYYLLDNQDAIDAYNKALSSIKDFDYVLLYEYHTRRSVKLILRCLFRKVKYAINCDGAVDISTKFPQKTVKTFLIKRATLCLAGGIKAKQYFEAYGAKADKIFIHNFTSVYDGDIEKTTLVGKLEARKRRKIVGETVSVSVGQLIKRKQFDKLIDIWKEIPDNHHLYIIGSGVLHDELETLIVQTKKTNIHLLDFMSRDELFRFYSLCDLFVFTTKEDIWGLVINEAMAKGLPIVSNDQCVAAVEMVEDGVNGYIIPSTDDVNSFNREFGEKVLRILNDSNCQERFADAAILTAKNYTYENMANIVLMALGEKNVKK